MTKPEEEKKVEKVEGESNLVFLHVAHIYGEEINLEGMKYKLASRLERFAAIILDLDDNGAAIVMTAQQWQSLVKDCLEENDYEVQWSASEKTADPELTEVENPEGTVTIKFSSTGENIAFVRLGNRPGEDTYNKWMVSIPTKAEKITGAGVWTMIGEKEEIIDKAIEGIKHRKTWREWYELATAIEKKFNSSR